MATKNNSDQENKDEVNQKSDETTWAVLCHLGGLFGAVIPPGNIILPLIIWMLQRDKLPFVDDQGREAINFQISVSIYAIICAILIFIAIGFFLLIVLAIFDLVITINAALQARDGVTYRYPMTIRFI